MVTGLSIPALLTIACWLLPGPGKTPSNESALIGHSAVSVQEAGLLSNWRARNIEIRIAADDSGGDARFTITTTRDTTTGEIFSAIDASVRGTVTNIAKVAGRAESIDRSNYSKMGIPATAAFACDSWWAGLGSYFYIIQSGHTLLVYQGWQEKQQTNSGFHWKQWRRVAL